MFKALILGSSVVFSSIAQAGTFSSKLDLSARLDDRSGKDLRWQYRVRFYPQYHFDQDKRWSVNGFAVTGDEFSSSHNTVDSDASQYFYLRRLYLRFQDGENKTEFGVIPTYKGRVSSTGLSKDGFIAGLRQVLAMDNGKFEMVVGDLDDTRASHAFSAIDEVNYVEVEYSSIMDNQFAYELSADRVLGNNFARGELRYQPSDDTTYSSELIQRLDTSGRKWVFSVEHGLTLFDKPADLFAYYSYVDEDFGPRAELTEDFLATGHGIALELESQFSHQYPLAWFAKFELYEGNSRFQLGVKYSFSQSH